jgi:hypothetical protein
MRLINKTRQGSSRSRGEMQTAGPETRGATNREASLSGFMLVAASALAGTLGPASAGQLPIDGAYGNVEGCAFFMTGKVVSDLQLLLTPNEVSSYVSSCDELNLVGERDAILTVNGLCHEEGEADAKPAQFTISRNPDATFTVNFDQLSSWGPLAKCL